MEEEPALEAPEEPDPEDPEPEPETTWPTVRLTAATVPVMVDLRVASVRLVCAVVTCVLAEVTDAWSESSWLVVAVPLATSVACLACAAVRVALAESSWACSAEDPMVARVSPLLTLSPAVTLTEVTWPETPKSRSAVAPGWMVPDAATVCCIVPVVMETVSVVTVRGAAADDLRVASQTPTPAPAAASTTMTTMATTIRLRPGRRRHPGGFASMTVTGPVGSPGPTASSVTLVLGICPKFNSSDLRKSRELPVNLPQLPRQPRPRPDQGQLRLRDRAAQGPRP